MSLSMSSGLGDDDLRKVFAVGKFQQYERVKLDISGLNVTVEGVGFVLGLIQGNVKELELHLNGLSTEPGFGKFLA